MSKYEPDIKTVKNLLHEARDIFASGGKIVPLMAKVDEAIGGLVKVEVVAQTFKDKLDAFCLEWQIDKGRFPNFFAEGYEEGDENAPFFSEACLYCLIGKEDARTILALINNFYRLLNLDW